MAARRAGAWASGCSVSSSAAAKDSTEMVVTFVSTVSAAKSSAVKEAAAKLTNEALYSAMEATAAALNMSVVPYSVSSIAPPSTALSATVDTVSTGSGSGLSAMLIVLIAAGGLVTLVVVVSAVVCCLRMGGSDAVSVQVQTGGFHECSELRKLELHNPPPVGAVYLKNGVWLNAKGRPFPSHPANTQL